MPLGAVAEELGMSASVLVVEPVFATSAFLAEELEAEAKFVSSTEEALRSAEDEPFDLFLVDLATPGAVEMTFLRRLARLAERAPIVLISDEEDVEEAAELLQRGAFDLIVRPVENARLLATVTNALAHGDMRRQLRAITNDRRSRDGIATIVGESEAIRRGKKLVREVARTDSPILIRGERGVGKEAFARAAHVESERAACPFARLDAAHLREVWESVGSFRDVQAALDEAWTFVSDTLRAARGGTIFLEHVDLLPLQLQERLLPLVNAGGRELPENDPDLRFVAATEKDLEHAVRAGSFRQDLFDALSTFELELPRLSERSEDIGLLAEELLAMHRDRLECSARSFEPEVLQAFEAYDWPGNVRELETVVQRALLLEEGESITPSSLPTVLRNLVPMTERFSPPADGILAFVDEEKRILFRALNATDWNVAKAASELGIGRATLYRKIQKYDLKAQAG